MARDWWWERGSVLPLFVPHLFLFKGGINVKELESVYANGFIIMLVD